MHPCGAIALESPKVLGSLVEASCLEVAFGPLTQRLTIRLDRAGAAREVVQSDLAVTCGVREDSEHRMRSDVVWLQFHDPLQSDAAAGLPSRNWSSAAPCNAGK